MEVFYCKECRSRVSSFDLDAGKGKEVGGNVYCVKCVKNVVISEPADKAAKKAVSSVVKPKPKKKPSSKVKIPNIHRTQTIATPKKGNPAVPILIIIVILVIAGVAAAVLSKKEKKPLKKADSTGTVYELDNPDPIKVPDPDIEPPDSVTPAPDPSPVVKPEPVKTERAEIPEPPAEKQFETREGWSSFLSESWNEKWVGKFGTWTYEDEMIKGITDDGMGTQVLVSKETFGGYEAGLVIAVDNSADVEIGFQRSGIKGGRLKLIALAPGKWHTVELQVSRTKLVKAVVNGTEITGKGDGKTVTLYTDRMASKGNIEIRAVPQGVAACTVAVCEVGMKVDKDAMYNGPRTEPYTDINGVFTIEAEEFAWSDRRGDSTEYYISQAVRGFTGKGYLATKHGSPESRWEKGCEAGYKLECTEAGDYYIWVRRNLDIGKDDAQFLIGLDGERLFPKPSDGQKFMPEKWRWFVLRNPVSLTAGSHELVIRRKKPGYRMDRLILAKDPDFVPQGIKDWTSGNTHVQEGVFQHNFKYWKPWGKLKACKLDTEKLQASRSVRLKAGESMGNEVKAQLIPGKIYRLRGWGKAAPEGTGGFMGIVLKQGNTDVLRKNVSFSDQSWHVKDILFRAPQDKTWSQVLVYFGTHETGDGWFTKIRLETFPGNKAPEVAESGSEIAQPVFMGKAIEESNGLVIIEAEGFHSNIPTEKQSWKIIDDEKASGARAVQVLPDISDSVTPEQLPDSPRLDYYIDFKTTGTYVVWLYGKGKNKKADSVHIGFNNQPEGSEKEAVLSVGTYDWLSKKQKGLGKIGIIVKQPGVHVLNIWMREDGAVVDRILLTTDVNFKPSSVPLAPPPPQVDITNDFTEALIQTNGSAEIINGNLRITNNRGQKGSAYLKEKVNVEKFKISFTFRLTKADGDGFCFIIQNKGMNALGGDGNQLGIMGIDKSVGFGINIYRTQAIQMYNDGRPTNTRGDITGLQLKSGHIFRVDVEFKPKQMDIVITDTENNAAFSFQGTPAVKKYIEGTEAWIGFTGGTGSAMMITDILSLQYEPIE